MTHRLRQLLQQALHWVSLNLSAPAGEDWVMEGASNLIRQPEFDNISATRQLVSVLDQREEWIRAFDAPGIAGQGVRVVIGDDSSPLAMPALSMVTEEVRLSSHKTVRIGVIGPRRMAYNNIIRLVKNTAAVLAKADIRR
jgi:heat-inducible transcriptional repressor